MKLYQLEHSIAEPAQVISHFTYTWFSIQKLIIIMYLMQLPKQITTHVQYSHSTVMLLCIWPMSL